MKRIRSCARAILTLLLTNIIEILANFNTYFIFQRIYFVQYATKPLLLQVFQNRNQYITDNYQIFCMKPCRKIVTEQNLRRRCKLFITLP